MTNRRLRRTISVCTTLLFVALITGVVTTSLANQASQITANSVFLPLVLRETLSKVHLPSISNRSPIVTNFGVQADVPDIRAAFLETLGVEWLRLDGPKWAEIQATEDGAYDWTKESARKFDQALLQLQRRSLTPRIIMILQGSPAWATIDGSRCGPIAATHYEKYAQFVRAVAQRYPNITYVELGNEPDVDIGDVPSNSGFGCWGKANDEFYGGRAYGDMLKVVYPAIKGVRSSIQVLNGGLLLDRPFNAATGANRSGRFIEGVFATGAGSSFDILNYHHYYNYTNEVPTPDGVSNIGPGAIDWKVPYLRELMQRYGVAEKPMYNTESALLCRVGADKLAACHDAQGNMVGRLMARASRDRINAVIWYLLDSDRFYSTAMVEPNSSTTRPVYDAFKHARSLLGGGQYVGALANQQSDVEGYRFQNVGLSVTIFWSDQGGKTATIPVPVGSTPRCTDRAGARIDCQNINGTVTLPATSRTTYVTVP